MPGFIPISLHHCRSKLNVKVNCTLIPSFPGNAATNYDVVGGIAKGHFEGDPDVAGIGVLLAFFGVTAISVFAGWVNAGVQFLSDKKVIKDGVDDDSPWEELIKTRNNIQNKTHDLLMACSDQQTLTGLGISIFLDWSQHACELSSYHYTIIIHLMLMSCTTFMLGLTNLSKFWEEKTKAWLRLIGGVVLHILTFFATARAYKHFPVLEDRDLLVLPATCSDQFSLASKLEHNNIRLLVVWGIITLFAIFGIVLNAVNGLAKCRWFGGRFKVGITSLQHFLGARQPDTSSSEAQKPDNINIRGIMVYVVYVGLNFSTAIVILIYLLGEDNPEFDGLALGQALPIVLFLLPLFQLVGIYNQPLLLLWNVTRKNSSNSEPEGSQMELAPLRTADVQ